MERGALMSDYAGIVNLISNVGFPIVIAIYLLHRFEKKLDALVNNIKVLSTVIEKQCENCQRNEYKNP